MEYSWTYCGVRYVLSEDAADPGMTFPQVKDAARVIGDILPPYGAAPELRALLHHVKRQCLLVSETDLQLELVWLLHSGRIRLSVQNQTFIPAAKPQALADTGMDYVEKYWFTFSNEVWAGRSNVPHWPGGESGLTLGPGYDIGSRKSADVENFLVRKFGMKKADAKLFADGAGLTGQKAKDYLDKNRTELRKRVVVSDSQEKELFRQIAPGYEAKIADHIRAYGYPDSVIKKLSAEQLEVMFDYEYNPGSKRKVMFKAIIKQEWDAALKHHKRGVPRRDKEMGEKLLRMKLESDKQRIPLLWNMTSSRMLA